MLRFILFMLIITASQGLLAYITAAYLPLPLWALIGGAVCTLAEVGYMGYVLLFGTGDRARYIPLFGQVWYWRDEAARLEYVEWTALIETAKEKIQGQVRACTRSGIAERSKAGGTITYLETMADYLGPFFLTRTGTLYSYIYDFPTPGGRKVTINDFLTEEFEANANQFVHCPTWVQEAKPNEFKNETGHYFLISNLLGDVRAKSALPTLVRFDEMIAALREKKGSSRSLGIGAWCPGGVENGQYHFVDLFGDYPHMFLLGATGLGKSVDLTQMILTLCLLNRQEDLQLYIVDPKIDFSIALADLPHLALPVQDSVAGGNEVMAALHEEMWRRSALFKKHKVSDWWLWNRKPPNGEYLPAVFGVFDEIQLMMDENPDGDTFQRQMWKFASLARRTGMGIGITTQIGLSEVVSTKIQTHFSARGVHYCDQTASVRALGNAAASRIEAIPGRLVFQEGAFQTICQAPVVASSYKGWNSLDRAGRKQRIAEGIAMYVQEVREKEGATPQKKLGFDEYINANFPEIALSPEKLPPEVQELLPDYELVAARDFIIKKTAEELAHSFGFGGREAVLNQIRSWSCDPFATAQENIYAVVAQNGRSWQKYDLRPRKSNGNNGDRHQIPEYQIPNTDETALRPRASRIYADDNNETPSGVEVLLSAEDEKPPATDEKISETDTWANWHDCDDCEYRDNDPCALQDYGENGCKNWQPLQNSHEKATEKA